MANEETETMKVKDLFETTPLLAGRTQIESSFAANKDDFEVDANNILNLKNKTSYWSASPDQFQSTTSAEAWIIDTTYTNRALAVVGGFDWRTITCHVNLPHGAVVTGAIIDGVPGATPLVWTLYRIQIAGEVSGTALASANVGTEDTTISNATIDNSTYVYYFGFGANSDEPWVTGARITYTTDYD